jgi:hypothetical protein
LRSRVESPCIWNPTQQGACRRGICGQRTVENCVITNNTAGYACCVAGVYLVGSSTLANSLIVGNRISSTASQTKAGGVFLNSASCQMINCTVVGNESTHLQTPDGVYFTAGTVVNSIITANGEGFADDFAASVPEPNVTYSCFAGVINGEGNIAADPQFADAANRDYTLSRASPARDAGTAVALADDLVGTPRPQGAGYDMGCYERPVSDVPECDFRIDSEAVGLPPLELQTTAITSWSCGCHLIRLDGLERWGCHNCRDDDATRAIADHHGNRRLDCFPAGVVRGWRKRFGIV